MFGFGPLESLLADDSVTEIMVNGPSDVFFERDGRLHRSEQRFADEGQLRALIDRVLGPLGRRIDEASPMVNARLPEGHRVHVIIPPLALDGPVMTVQMCIRDSPSLPFRFGVIEDPAPPSAGSFALGSSRPGLMSGT